MSTTLKGAPAPEAYQPTDADLIQFIQDHAVFHETKRFKTLDRKHAFLKCREYDHQATDWDDKPAEYMETISAEAVFPAGTVPSGGEAMDGKKVREKRPTAPTRRAKVTTERFTNLLLSERSKPKIVVDQDSDTDAMLEAIREQAKFWSKMRAARNLGGGIGSVVVTVHVRSSKWSYEVHNSKFCTPIWKDPRDRTLAGLLIMYRTQREENETNEKGQVTGTRMVDYLCRRIITEQSDIVYEEMSFDEVIKNPAASWVVDGDLQVEHGLGRFPGVWIQNTAVEQQEDDGESDCEGAYQSIDTDDRLIAQGVFSALGNMDPTVVTSTDPKAVQQMNALVGLQKGSRYAIETGVGGKADYMEMTGAGITAGMAISDKIEAQVDVITGVVIPDDSTLASAQSGEALELRFSPMLAKAADLREQYGEAIVELMNITELIARKFLEQPAMPLAPDAAGNPRIGKYQFKLPLRKFKVVRGNDMVEVAEPHKLGKGGYISLQWGPWFPPTEADKGAVIRNSAAAAAANFITRMTAARRVAPFFGVQDVEGEVAQALQEAEADAQKQLGQYEGAIVRDAAQGSRS